MIETDRFFVAGGVMDDGGGGRKLVARVPARIIDIEARLRLIIEFEQRKVRAGFVLRL